ncbi:MAG: M20 family metallo-hydrolase [Aminivibrio sp.]|jgi:hydantoinase/carbamoylase family amidase
MIISPDRFLADLENLGKIGWVEGEGMDRAAFTPNYAAARKFVEERMREAGLAVEVDGVGNVFGRLEGSDPSLPAIYAGSHLDAVPGGGKYDGPLGVMTALEAARAIRERGTPMKRSLVVAGFTAEEGGEMGGTFGSRAFAGLLEEPLSPEKLGGAGLTPEGVRSAKAAPGSVACYLELHIEQGPFLERRGIQIGIPTGIVGIARYEVRLEGEANHAGTTPMNERRDAMREASELLAEWFAWTDTRDDFVCNVGVFSLHPGAVAIVPEGADFILEIRSLKDSVTEEAAEKFKSLLESRQKASVSMKRVVWKGAVDLDPFLQDAVEKACGEAGVSFVRMPSGASHDANPMARITRAGMIFVPSVKGISHSKDEYTSPEDCARGADILARAILEADRSL